MNTILFENIVQILQNFGKKSQPIFFKNRYNKADVHKAS